MPFECAAQSISYTVHAGQDQWVLLGEALGYRHPWRSVGGQCVYSANRAAQGQTGRLKLGKLYQGEWFTLQLGYRADQKGLKGIPSGSLPHMVGARYEVAISRGEQRLTLGGLLTVPGEIQWLPATDRLFLIDSALKILIEIDSVSPYIGALNQVNLFQ